MEGKVGLFKTPALSENGGLLSQRPPSPLIELSRSFTGTQEEAEQRKGGLSHATP